MGTQNKELLSAASGALTRGSHLKLVKKIDFYDTLSTSTKLVPNDS